MDINSLYQSVYYAISDIDEQTLDILYNRQIKIIPIIYNHKSIYIDIDIKYINNCKYIHVQMDSIKLNVFKKLIRVYPEFNSLYYDLSEEVIKYILKTQLIIKKITNRHNLKIMAKLKHYIIYL